MGQPEPFAKLYETDEGAQVLIELIVEDCRPGIRCRAPDLMGAVVESKLMWGDTEFDWFAAGERFETFDREAALEWADSLHAILATDMAESAAAEDAATGDAS